jgi:hydroxyacylglutathione hydrolase
MIRVTPIACLSDNYAYLIRGALEGMAAVVDASEADPVLEAAAHLGVSITAILCTHHHHDHVGGNEQLLRSYPQARVYGHASDRGRIPGITDELVAGSELDVAGIRLRALHVPGHTLGAIAYVTDEVVFTGDTLFHAGCGRLFEGTADMMHRSLSRELASLRGAVRVYPGHEYTLANLSFARAVEPENQTVEDRLSKVRALRARGEPTVGATMDEELATNPFLRCSTPAVRAFAKAAPGASDEEVFAALRRAKDVFRAPP